MITEKRFENIYFNLKEHEFKDLKILKNKALWEMIFNVFIITVLCWGCVGIFRPLSKSLDPIITNICFTIYIFIIPFVIYKTVKNKQWKAYKANYKSKIIENILKEFVEDFEYMPNKGINRITYSDAEFERFDIFQSEDLIHGKFKDKSFDIAEVHTQKLSKNKQEEQWHYELFRGLVAVAHTPKLFGTNFYLTQNGKKIKTNKYNFQRDFKNIKVELDMPEFEKYFDVYCTDKILAMQLLTADIMEELTRFKKEIKIQYELTIKESTIYLRFKSGKMFEPPNFFKPLSNKATVYKYYRILDFIFLILDKLVKMINETEYDN